MRPVGSVSPSRKTKADKYREQAVYFTSPESSNVEAGSYDPETKVATIVFKNKKDPRATIMTYRYENVLRDDWDDLKNAPSKGKHVRDVFAKIYKGVRL